MDQPSGPDRSTPYVVSPDFSSSSNSNISSNISNNNSNISSNNNISNNRRRRRGSGGGASTASTDSSRWNAVTFKLVLAVGLVVVISGGVSLGFYFSSRTMHDDMIDERRPGDEGKAGELKEGSHEFRKNHHKKGKSGQCPSPTEIGESDRECHGDWDCRNNLKCCPVHGETERVCAEPTHDAPEKPGLCPPRDGSYITSSDCSRDVDCADLKKCCALGRGPGKFCRDPLFEKPGHCPPTGEMGIAIYECGKDLDCQDSQKCCPVGGGAGRVCKQPTFTSVTPVPTPVWSTTGKSSLRQCPDWAILWKLVSEPCLASLLTAATDPEDRCSHYGNFLKCASFLMLTMNYSCSDQELRQTASEDASLPSIPGPHGHDFSSRDHSWHPHHHPHPHPHHHHHHHNHAHSSSYYGGYGEHSWGSHLASSHHYDRSNVYGSEGHTWYRSWSHGYHGSSGWHGSSSPDYYGSSRWHGSGSPDYYGSSRWHGSGSPDYYGSSRWHGSGSHGYYGSWSGYRSDASDLHSSSPWYDTTSSDYDGSDYGDPSDYDGYGNGYPTDAMGSSSGYYGDYVEYGNRQMHSVQRHSSHTLPVDCKHHVPSFLADMETTEPCSNPDAYRYLLQYHCKDEDGTAGMEHHPTSYNPHSDPYTHHQYPPYSRQRRSVYPSSKKSSSKRFGDACLKVWQKARCIANHLNMGSLKCLASTIFDTMKQYKHAMLTKEINTCLASAQRLLKDDCFQSLINAKTSCLLIFNKVPKNPKPCGVVKSVVKSSVQRFPGKCHRKNAPKVIRYWLTMEHALRNISQSLGVTLSDESKERTLKCFKSGSSSKVNRTSVFNVVQLKVGSQWATMCGSGWNDTGAEVVCKSLGYSVGYATLVDEGKLPRGVPQHHPEMWITNMSCSGREKSPSDCSYHKVPGCPGGDMLAGAACYKSVPVFEIVSDKGDLPYGYVKRTVDGRSAFVTGSYIDNQVARKLCKAAGYPHGGMPFHGSLPEMSMGSYRWDIGFVCRLQDRTIEQCSGNGAWGWHNLKYIDRVIASQYFVPTKVFCFANGVRLHNSLLNSTGMAQVVSTRNKTSTHPKQLYGVCGEGFTNFTATLFCKALGLGFQSGVALGYQPFKSDPDTYNYVQFSCDGTEKELGKCRNITVRAYQYSDSCTAGFAAVTCTPPVVPESANVTDMTIKLDTDNETVLVYNNHEWGYICNDRWTQSEAEKVCKRLHYDRGTVKDKWTASTSRPFLIHGVSCERADAWSSCSYQRVASDICRSNFPAAVYCYNQDDVSTYSLYNGKDPHPTYGWVLVKHQHERGHVCASVDPRQFYSVLCRQLGFLDGDEYRDHLPDNTNLPVWVGTFQSCNSQKNQHVDSCLSGSWQRGGVSEAGGGGGGGGMGDGHDRSYDEGDRKPVCHLTMLKAFCYNSTARVHSGYHNTSGVLELAVNGSYHRVCAQTSTYTQQAADVLCRTLTTSSTSSAIVVSRNVFMVAARPPAATGAVHVSFSCNGTERHLNQCLSVLSSDYSSDSCQHDEKMVALVCYEGQKPNGSITGWKIGPEGSVLVRRFGLWGHVCSPSWKDKESATVCRTLGYESGVALNREAWGHRLAQWVDGMNCSAHSGHVSQCSNLTLRNYSLEEDHAPSCHARRARCFNQSEVPTLFLTDNALLTSSSSSSSQPHLSSGSLQGRVGVLYNGTRGYLCSPEVPTTAEKYDALCRILGYRRGGQALDSATLPELSAYSVAWQASLTCGQWDRTVHPITCLQGWHQTPVREADPYYGTGSEYYASSRLSQCGERVPAVSCFGYEDYRLVSTSHIKSRGLLLVWNDKKGNWERVCASHFSSTEAEAACRQLGFSKGGELAEAGRKPELTYSLGNVRFQCSGEAGEKLSNCTTSYASCDAYNTVWLNCEV